MDRFSAGGRSSLVAVLASGAAVLANGGALLVSSAAVLAAGSALSACDATGREFGTIDAGVGAGREDSDSGANGSGGASGDDSDASAPIEAGPGPTSPITGDGGGGSGATADGGSSGSAGARNGSAGDGSTGEAGKGTGGAEGAGGDASGGKDGGTSLPAGGSSTGGDAGTSISCMEGETRSCEEAGLLGNCASGTQDCVGGSFGPCTVEPATEDACATGDDADCDGYANEGCDCMAGAVQSCAAIGAMGNCATGTVTCDEDGVLGSCTVQALTADSCAIAGDDADCDGSPNEDCECEDDATQPCGPASDQGACKFGTSTCQDGAWGACVGAVHPASRDCRSSLDFDCNGTPDNTLDATCQCLPSTSEACGQHPGQDNNGACRAGSRTCNAGTSNATSAWGACTGSVGPSAMVDSCATLGNDANCDGTVNGGCDCLAGETTTCGTEYGYQGQCAAYSLTCAQNGTWAAAATACAAQNGDTCAPPGQCVGAVWGNPSTPWGAACWQ